jgi:type IV pilus assembly protein PilO
MPIAIKVLGTYHDLGAFASDISKLSRIVTIGDINVQTQPLPKDAKPSQVSAALVIEAVAKTYRYLDADEVAAKQKAEKEAKAKAGKKSGK